MNRDFVDPPDWKVWFLKPALIISCLGLLIEGCSYLNKKAGLKNDNIIETNIENVIESYLGLDIDLTPSDPDDDDYTLDMWRKD